MKHSRACLLLIAAPLAGGCGSEPSSPPSTPNLPTTPPQTITKVTSTGFTSPTDAVVSPDGQELYFAAYTADEGKGAVYRAATAAGAEAQLMGTGALSMPIGLVLSCDGETLYVADAGAETGGVYAVSTKGGEPTDLGVTGLEHLGGLAMGPDCETLHATGRTATGEPALFAVARSGGAARLIFGGAPLVSPTGLHVDTDGVAWVMDHLATGAKGPGVLFAIPQSGGQAREVASDLRMGTPGGVSLTAGGGTAMMPTRDANGNAQLTSVVIATGEMSQLPMPEMIEPAGVRSSRGSDVVVFTDPEGNAIHYGK